jgi:hypothetical protein
LEEYAGVFQVWQPKNFKPIDFDFQKIKAAELRPEPRAVGQAFSGGVDSFFTLWSHLPENQPLEEFRVTHGLFIQGMDFELSETAAYQSALQKLSLLFKDSGLTLIPAATNGRDFWRYRISLEIMYGTLVIGTAMALGKLLTKFYFPATYAYSHIVPVGSSPVSDHLLSTENLQIIHHGGRFSRHKKMDRIVGWEPVQRYLRVCARTPKEMDGMNCSRCNKCMQIGARLEIFGVYSKFETFKQPFSWFAYIPWGIRNRLGDFTYREVLPQAIATRRWDIYALMVFARTFSWINRTIRNSLLRLLPSESKYRLKKRFYAGTPNRSV